MAETTVREHDPRIHTDSFGDLFGDLADSSAALIRDEIELAKQEFRDKMKAIAAGAIVGAAGALIGLIGLLALTAAAIVGLAHYMSVGLSALIIGFLLVVIGGAAAFVGARTLKKTGLKPEKTIRSLKEDKDWLKAQMG